jgi:hypothetical protein
MFLDIILIPKKILLLTIVVLAVLAIQFYSMSDEKLFTVYADNTSSYLSNYDNNNVINSGIKVDSYPVGLLLILLLTRYMSQTNFQTLYL